MTYKREQFGMIYRSICLRWNEVGQAGFLFYTYLATYRRKRDGVLINLPRSAEIARQFGVKPNVVCAWWKKLKAAKWIIENGGDLVAAAGFDLMSPHSLEVNESQGESSLEVNTLDVNGSLQMTVSESESSHEVNGCSPEMNGYSPQVNKKEVHIRNKNQKESETKKDGALVLFENWKLVRNHPTAKLDAKREKILMDRLTEGYSLQDLLLVPVGVQNSALHRGENATGTVYDKIELIYRDGGQVELFSELARSLMLMTGGQANAAPVQCPRCKDNGGFETIQTIDGPRERKCTHKEIKADNAV